MRLLVISHTPHYLRCGQVVGWGPTIRELDHLATRFSRVRHIACMYDEPAPASALPYTADNVELVPVPPAGAEGFGGKLDVLRTSPKYLRAILSELDHADMVHVRAPANIALLAMMVLSLRKRPLPRWFKYAGNWRPDGPESLSYTLQRRWLARGGHLGVVTVNGAWPAQPPWVRSFYNPSLEEVDLEHGRRVALAKRMTAPVRVLFVGSLTTSKGAGRALEVIGQLRRRSVDATLELVGDGDERPRFEKLARELGIQPHVRFSGWQPTPAVHEAYGRAHLLLLPTASEGWPKVLSEGMAFGVVPLAGAVSSIPQYLARFQLGAALPTDDVGGFTTAIERYAAQPERWEAESGRAVSAARAFSFTQYLVAVDAMLREMGLPT